MTVEQLIQELKQYPSHCKVIVRGYEGGVTEVSKTQPELIALDVNTEWYYGSHEIVEDWEMSTQQLKDHEQVLAVLIR